MGEDGCAWVRGGAGGISNTKSRHTGCIYGVTGQHLGVMAGEISPDIMFLGVWQRVVWMGAGGHKSVRMDSHGHIRKGGEQKQGKKSPEWSSRGCFAMYGRGKKKQ